MNVTLKMEGECSSEIPENSHEITQRHLEADNLHSRCWENLKSHKINRIECMAYLPTHNSKILISTLVYIYRYSVQTSEGKPFVRSYSVHKRPLNSMQIVALLKLFGEISSC